MRYITNGNIYAPVMMMAEKAADLILGNTPLAPEPVAFFRQVRHRPRTAPDWSAHEGSAEPGVDDVGVGRRPIALAAASAVLPSLSIIAAISFCWSVVSWNFDRKSKAALFLASSPALAALYSSSTG